MTRQDVTPTKPRGLLIPVVSGILSLIIFLGLSVGTNFLLTEQNNRTQQKTEQVSIAAAVHAAIVQEKAQEKDTIDKAIQANNKSLCDVIITTNQVASHLSPSQQAMLTVYQKRILEDYKILAVKYKCGS